MVDEREFIKTYLFILNIFNMYKELKVYSNQLVETFKASSEVKEIRRDKDVAVVEYYDGKVVEIVGGVQVFVRS